MIKPLSVKRIDITNEDTIMIPEIIKPDYIRFNEFDRLWTPDESEAEYKMYKNDEEVKLAVVKKLEGYKIVLPKKMTGMLCWGFSPKESTIKELDFGFKKPKKDKEGK